MLRDIVNRALVTIEPHDRVVDAARRMAERNVGSVLVLSGGRPRGILTDRDIVVRCLAQNLDVNDTTVENVLSESLETVVETDGIFDCIRKMEAAGVRRIPVVDASNHVIGVISFGDLLKVLGRELYELTQTITHTNSANGVTAPTRSARLPLRRKRPRAAS